MFELPLFPLNTVLFPGTPINLRIFEDRYKEMIDHCLTTNQPFGVVLIRQGMEALGPLANPYPIGCTAQITQMEPSEDGQMNILAVGLERFQIHSLKYDQSYLVGEVETFPLDSPNPLSIVQAGRQLRPWVERYLTVLANAAENIEFNAEQLPSDPLALGYLAAALVQIPTAQKQVLLATQDATDLLTDIRTIYRREVALMNAIIEHDVEEPEGLFSVN